MADQDRPRDAGESGPGTATDSGSDERGNGGQSVTSAVKGATGEAAEEVQTAAPTPPLDFKAVLRDAQRAVTDELKAGITQRPPRRSRRPPGRQRRRRWSMQRPRRRAWSRTS